MTFVGPADRQYLRRIESFTGKQYPLKSYSGFQPAPAPARPAGNHHQPRQHRVQNASRPVVHQRSQETASHGGRWSNYAVPGRKNDARKAQHHGRNQGPPKQGQRKKNRRSSTTSIMTVPRKKKSAPKRLDTFSSDGGAWSNH
jgi:hypothetical protein